MAAGALAGATGAVVATVAPARTMAATDQVADLTGMLIGEKYGASAAGYHSQVVQTYFNVRRSHFVML